MKLLATLAFAVLGLAAATAAEPERIISFSADITVAADGSMTVVENLGVHSERLEVIHGIVRSIPTNYHDATGKPVALKVTDVVVGRDGYADGVQVQVNANSIDIRIGKEDVKIGRGNHVYQLTYKVSGAVADLPAGYQLAWNVTGLSTLPVETAAARIYLPGAAKSTRLSATTGPIGSNTGEGTITESTPGKIVAHMPKTLNPQEALTIFVDWPKAQ